MSAVSWVKIDGFEKFKIMVVRLDLMKEKNEKRYQFLLVYYGFENSMNQNFFLFSGNVGLSDISRFFLGDS